MSNSAINSIMNPTVITVRPDESLDRANRVMREYDIRHLPVLAGANLVGMVSDRDLALVSTFCGKDWQSLRNFACEEDLVVEDVMSRNPVVFRSSDSLTHAIQTAITTRFGAFPVMDQGRLVGMVSVVDLLEVCLERVAV